MGCRLGGIVVRVGTHLACPARPLPRGVIDGYHLGRQVTGAPDCHLVVNPANWSGAVADARR